jgi:hypothetical protein
VYRLNLFYRVYHLVVGIAALVGAVWCYRFLIMSAGLALFAVFMIARPLVLKVTVNQYSVTVSLLLITYYLLPFRLIAYCLLLVASCALPRVESLL